MPNQSSTSFYAMGSRITVLASESSPEIKDLLAQTRSWFQDWEKCLSRFRPQSELSRLNQQNGQTVRVSPVLWSVLRAALRGARQTGGLVNPTILAAMESAGYDRSFEKISGLETTGGSTQPSLNAWRSIDLDPRHRTIRTPPGIRLDLGGIAKGWAADRAVRRLGKHVPALVNAGGDIAVSGPIHGDQAWQIGIGRPEDGSLHLAVLPLLRGGVATSGRNYRRWEQAGRQHHHLIDPRTGLPADTDIMAATVVAPSALEAEIAAKAVLILGSQAGLEWLAARPQLAGILALENGAVLSSTGLSAYLRLT